MRSLEKILLPVDFSERTPGAARYARTLALHFHSEVTALHALTPPRYDFGAMELGGPVLQDLYANRAAQVERDLAAFLGAALAGVNARWRVIEGDPAHVIVDFAHDEKASLIVLPTHGYGPFRRFILGSTTAKVLHDADCPVWTGVHMEEAPAPEAMHFRQVLCAIDLGAQSCRALEWAAYFGAEFGSRLTVLHVTSAGGGGEAREDWRPRLESEIRQEIQTLQERLAIQADVQVEAGDAPHVICAAARRMAADLLVIGRGSAAGVFGRLRTNAYAIIRQSPCPVVSV